MPEPGTLATVASIISGFGVVMLFFRIQRELQIHEKDELIGIRIPKADWLLIGATLISLLFVILPIISFSPQSMLVIKISTAACSSSSILVAGYILSILAHYRLLFGHGRVGPRENPEPAEKVLVSLTVALAMLLFVVILLR